MISDARFKRLYDAWSKHMLEPNPVLEQMPFTGLSSARSPQGSKTALPETHWRPFVAAEEAGEDMGWLNLFFEQEKEQERATAMSAYKILMVVESEEKAKQLAPELSTRDVFVVWCGEKSDMLKEAFFTVIVAFAPDSDDQYSWLHANVLNRNARIMWTS